MNEPLLAQALLTELGKKEKRRIKTAVSWETLGELIRDALDPKPLEEDVTAVTTSPLPVMLSEYPKLKVRFDYAKGGEALEWIVVGNGAEEAPYHAGGWYTFWPPNSLRQIQGQAGSLESHIEKLKADGVKERPKEDWQRRKESSKK